MTTRATAGLSAGVRILTALPVDTEPPADAEVVDLASFRS
jgi:hypothetical protein